MAHAVIRTGGKQFLVEEGKTIRVPSVEAEPGGSIELDVLVSSGADTRVGAPAVAGVKVSATVVDHGRGETRPACHGLEVLQTDFGQTQRQRVG